MDSQHIVFSHILRISHLCFARSFKHLSAHGIYPGQVPILKMLSKKDGQAQKDLVRKGMVRPSTVTVTLQRMERAGLIERRIDPANARQYWVFLTPKGWEAVEEAESVLIELNEKMLSCLTEAEQLLMQRLLGQMADTLAEEGDWEPEE